MPTQLDRYEILEKIAQGDVEQAFSQARTLSGQVAVEPLQLVPLLYGLWLYYRVRSEHQTELELAQQILRLAQSSHDPDLLLGAHKTVGDGLKP